MTNDYADLNLEENAAVKQDLQKLISVLELKGIPYWFDFSFAEKIHNNRRSLYYLNSVDLATTEDYFDKFYDAALGCAFWLFGSQNRERVIKIAPGGIEMAPENGMSARERVFVNRVPTYDRILKWINVYKYFFSEDKNFLHLDMKDDVKINKELFETKIVEYKGINCRVLKNYELIKKIRFGKFYERGPIWNHSPRKRVDKEKNWGFVHIKEME